MTGSLFVLVRNGDDDYCGYILCAEDDINNFLDALGMTPADTNRLINTENTNPQIREDIETRLIQRKFSLTDEFMCMASQ